MNEEALLMPSQTLAFEEEGNTKKAADSSPIKMMTVEVDLRKTIAETEKNIE